MANRYWVGGTSTWDTTAGTKWSLSSGGAGGEAVPTSSDDVYFDGNSGAVVVTVNANTNCAALNFTSTLGGDYTGEFKAGSVARVMSIYGSVLFVSGMTLSYNATYKFAGTSGTQTITSAGQTILGNYQFNGSGGTFQLADNHSMGGTSSFTLTAGTFDPNGKTVSFVGTSHTLTGSFSFYNLTRTGTATTTDDLVLESNITVTNVFTANGNSTTNRLFIRGDDTRTQRTITSASNSFSNVDFLDIVGAGAGDWDLSAITGLSGDCGYNSGITFTTAKTLYWVNYSGGSWSSTASWSETSGGLPGSRVPLPQDTVIIDANSITSASRTITADMDRLGCDITSTNVANSPTLALGTYSKIFGSLALGTHTSITGNILGVYGSANETITTNGNTIGTQLHVKMKVGTTLSLADACILTGTVYTYQGGFDLNDFNLTASTFDMSLSSGSDTVISLGSGVLELTGASSVFYNRYNSATFNCETSTIKLTNNSTSAKRVYLNDATYYTFWNATQGTGTLTYYDSNTFNTLKSDAGRTNIFFRGETNTVTNFDFSGTLLNLTVIQSDSAGSKAYLVKAGGGDISNDYLSIKDSGASPANTWYAGLNSTDVSGNSGWYFIEPPPPPTYVPRLLTLLGVG